MNLPVTQLWLQEKSERSGKEACSKYKKYGVRNVAQEKGPKVRAELLVFLVGPIINIVPINIFCPPPPFLWLLQARGSQVEGLTKFAGGVLFVTEVPNINTKKIPELS